MAILTNAYPPQARGGAGQIAEKQVKLLQEAGHEVRVWIGSLEWIKQPAIIRLQYHAMDLVYQHPRTSDIVAWKPDVLITHNLTGCGLGTASFIQRKGIRWVHILHDVQLFEPSGQVRSAQPITLWQKFWSTARRPIFGQPDLVVSPTQWLLDQHVRRGWFTESEQRVIPNPAPEKVDVDPVPHAIPRILFVGRFSEDKGSEIIKYLMQQQAEPMEWHLVGPGTEYVRVENLPSGSQLTTHGVQSTEAILQLMSRMDVLLVPSCIEENQPTVILEAAACGLPVIAADQGGIRETLGAAGIVVSSVEPAAWKEVLSDFLAHRTDPKWRQRMETVWERSAPGRYLAAFADGLK